jgi:hypothetical protein
MILGRDRRFQQTLFEKRLHLLQEEMAAVNGIMDPEPFPPNNDNFGFFQIGKMP